MLRFHIGSSHIHIFRSGFLVRVTQYSLKAKGVTTIQTQRWSPSFGQPDSGVKVDTMRFDRLLSLCSLWGWFPLRRPLNMSGGTGFSYG